MKTLGKLCGMECKFATGSKVWEFFEFSEFALESYYFYVVDAFVYSDGVEIKLPDRFKAEYFKELIRQSFVGECFVLHLYPESAFPEEIETYQDFLQSECEIIILMYDCCFVEVYCKNNSWLQLFLKKARSIDGTVVEEKYTLTDARTIMYV